MYLKYSIKDLYEIAKECNEFEHVINAMGYGYSLINVSEASFTRKCDDCVKWQNGHCGIFVNELSL